MTRYRDLEAMIETLGLAIARQEAEEDFFRRSAAASTSDVARSLFAEIADDMKGYVERLERRKDHLEEALEALRGRGKNDFALGGGRTAATDPVCGMKVDEGRARHTFDYQGRTYYFCSEDCQKAFALDPRKNIER